MKFCWVEEKQSFTSKPESLQHFPVGQLASLQLLWYHLQVSTIFRTIPDKSPGKTKNSEWCELRPGWSDRVRNDLQISSILFNYVQLYNHIISNTYYEYHIMRYKLTTTEKLTPGSGPAALPVTPWGSDSSTGATQRLNSWDWVKRLTPPCWGSSTLFAIP